MGAFVKIIREPGEITVKYLSVMQAAVITEGVDEYEKDRNSTGASDTLQNMSCRPRTTVKSSRMPLSEIPDAMLCGFLSINLIDYIPENLTKWLKGDETPPRKQQVGILHAILELGSSRSLETYLSFMEGRNDHSEKLLDILSEPPPLALKMPPVGLRTAYKRRAKKAPDLRTALYFITHTTHKAYLRNKTPFINPVFTKYAVQGNEEFCVSLDYKDLILHFRGKEKKK